MTEKLFINYAGEPSYITADKAPLGRVRSW